MFLNLKVDGESKRWLCQIIKDILELTSAINILPLYFMFAWNFSRLHCVHRYTLSPYTGYYGIHLLYSSVWILSLNNVPLQQFGSCLREAHSLKRQCLFICFNFFCSLSWVLVTFWFYEFYWIFFPLMMMFELYICYFRNNSNRCCPIPGFPRQQEKNVCRRYVARHVSMLSTLTYNFVLYF